MTVVISTNQPRATKTNQPKSTLRKNQIDSQLAIRIRQNFSLFMFSPERICAGIAETKMPARKYERVAEVTHANDALCPVVVRVIVGSNLKVGKSRKCFTRFLRDYIPSRPKNFKNKAARPIIKRNKRLR